MAESINLLSTAVRTSVDAISIASPVDGKLMFCNDAFLKWWKVKGNYHNLHYNDCFDVDSNLLKKAVQATMTGGWTGELTAKAMDKLKKEILPKIRKELDALRERLQELGKEEEMEPLEVKFREIEKFI